MQTSEIKKKIKFLEIKTKRILTGSLIGTNSTVLKGCGFEFDQIREYQEGDDVRFVDWKNSAKSNKLLVKQYFEERSRDILIVLDVSNSSFFSTPSKNKYEIISSIAYILSLIGQSGNDNVGLLLFSDVIHEFILPTSNKVIFNKLVKKIFEQKFSSKTTNIALALDFINNNCRKNSIIFFLSDFIDDSNYERKLKVIAQKNLFIAVRYLNPFEYHLPEIGLINIIDFETNKEMFIDLQKSNKIRLDAKIKDLISEQNKIFKKCKIILLNVKNDIEIFSQLIYFFKRLIY